MDESPIPSGSNVSLKIAIGVSIIGFILIALFIFYLCCKMKGKASKNDNRSNSSSTESFQQLYFTKTPYNHIKNLDQHYIERWSSVEQPSLTFYRVHMQDTFDNFYQPVVEQRLHSSVEQSKAIEYANHEIIFF